MQFERLLRAQRKFICESVQFWMCQCEIRLSLSSLIYQRHFYSFEWHHRKTPKNSYSSLHCCYHANRNVYFFVFSLRHLCTYAENLMSSASWANIFVHLFSFFIYICLYLSWLFVKYLSRVLSFLFSRWARVSVSGFYFDCLQSSTHQFNLCVMVVYGC